MKEIKKRSDCPISSALEIFGDKWSLLIIRDIALFGKNTYNEFLKSDEKIATNILADRITLLEKAGILIKEDHPESKAKIFYRLSKKGIDLLPVMFEISLWSDKYLLTPLQAKEIAKAYRKDKNKVLKKISENSKSSKHFI
jgi:DNA-binding HxlR family transcriptional regulator